MRKNLNQQLLDIGMSQKTIDKEFTELKSIYKSMTKSNADILKLIFVHHGLQWS